MFCSLNASAVANSVEIPVSAEETTLSDLSMVPSTNLQIVSVTPFEYIGGVNIRCWGQNSGRATVVAVGGVTPYTYQWSGLPYQTSATAIGMFAGSYSVTVTDALGNSVSESFTLIQNPPLQTIVTAPPILCNGGVTTIVVSAVGGAMPYSGLNTYDAVPGVYYFTVADANGCRDRASILITEPPVFDATSFAVPILCNGDSTDVSVQGFGGTTPYTGPGTYSKYAGTSSFTITDGNGCFAYTTIIINEPPPLVANISNSEILCRGGDSEVTVTGLGGMAPYMGVGVFTELAGLYQYTIFDNNGCQSTSSVTITQPTAVVATISNTPIACFGDLSSVEVIGSGGVSPYVGSGTYFKPAGLHTFNVMDANGCNVDISTIILEPTEIQLDISWDPISADEGTTDVEVIATGGTPSYIGTGTFNVGEGTHYFTVTDANGCSITQSIVVGVASASSFVIAGVNGQQIVPTKSKAISDGNNSFIRAAFNTSSEEIEIAYRLNYDSKVRIEILDMTGAIVQVIQEDMAIEGENYTCSIEQGTLTAGVYIYQFVTDSERQTNKFQVIR